MTAQTFSHTTITTPMPALLAGVDTESDDQQLLQAVGRGDTHALEVLYDRHSAVVYRLAFRMLRQRELSEEIVQEVFLRVWRRSASYEVSRGRVPQWIYGIAHNLCIDELRRIKVRPNPVYEDDTHPVIQSLVDENVDVPATAIANDQRRQIVDAIAVLPVAQRECIELAYYGGLSHQEIAEHLSRPLGTIKTRVRLGLQKLGLLLGNPHDSE